MKKKREKIFHIITLLIISSSVIFSAIFLARVWARSMQAAKDLGSSVAWALGIKGITPTVNTLPPNAVEVLPWNFSDFKAKLRVFGRLFIDWQNIKAFFLDVGIWIILAVCVVIPFALQLIFMWLDGKKRRRRKKKVVNDDNAETLPLQIFKKIESATWGRLKSYVKAYVEFAKSKKYYIIFFCVIWGISLNVATIVLEFAAYIVYQFRGLELSKLYLQFAKLAMDLTVTIDLVPKFVWVYVGLKLFNRWRTEKGLCNLEVYYEKNVEFLEEHKGALFFIGRQRSGKTTILQAIAQMMNKIFRRDALKGMQKKEKQFPNFPWINVVRTLERAKKKHAFPTLASYRLFVKRLKYHYRREKKGRYSEDVRKALFRHYRRKYGYNFKDFIFGYDDKKYPLKHNNGLVFVDIFKAISDYGQEYKIYAHGTSLIMSTIPIRADLKKEDYGNFPVFDDNSIRRTPEDIEIYSQYSHVMVFDSGRIGKFVDKDNPYRNGFEYGVEICPEWAKERGNRYSNQGKSKDSPIANATNDGYETNKKIQGQMVTIDNVDYYFYGGDDHREGSISAENSDMCTVITIAESLPKRIVLPFYALEQAIGLLSNDFYDKWKLDKNVLRSDKTLRGYLAQKLFIPIFNHCERIENKFGVEGRRLKVKDARTDELLSEKDVWWIIYAHDYNDKFATDALKTYATRKAKRSKYGLEDFPVFQSLEMTQEEMDSQGSYFYDYMNSEYIEEGKESA